MAARTTAALMKGIIETDDTNIPDLTPFIDAANLLVTDSCGSADYTADKLELIERWVAAHFYAVRDPRATAERAGPVGQNLQSKVDLGLAVTHYGQQAMLLDSEGGLAAANKQTTKSRVSITAGVNWLGVEDWDKDNI